MSASTAAANEAAFRQRMMLSGDLSEWLCQKVWDEHRSVTLGSDDFEVVGCEEVPGYEDEEDAVLLRRKSDGAVFEADIEADVRPALTPEQRERNRLRAAELTGQLSLPMEASQ